MLFSNYVLGHEMQSSAGVIKIPSITDASLITIK